MVRLFINGVWRKIIIDDFLPLGTNGELISAHSINLDEFWISLIEKAYLKVRSRKFSMHVSVMSSNVGHEWLRFPRLQFGGRFACSERMDPRANATQGPLIFLSRFRACSFLIMQF